MAIKKQPSYSEAIAEIEDFCEWIENEEVDVDLFLEKIKKTSFLIDVCYDKLHCAIEEVKKISVKINEWECSTKL